MRALLGTAVLLMPALALAAPPHAVIEVKPGETTFVRLYEVRVLSVQDPEVATAELLPSEELLISGKKAGTTDVVALAGGKLVGIRVHVRAPGTRLDDQGGARLEAARKRCPTLRVAGEGQDEELSVTPTPAACRTALIALFATDRFLTKQISIAFDPPALQAQLAELEPAVKAAGVEAPLHYQGATLVLQGALTPAQAARLIVAVYSHAVGGVPLDDGALEINAPDGGSDAIVPLRVPQHIGR
jgi:hypothetical protein